MDALMGREAQSAAPSAERREALARLVTRALGRLPLG